MKRFAAISHDADNVNKFNELEQSLTRKLLDLYWRKSVPDPINRQTLFATLIYYQLIPQKELAAATDSLLKAVRNEPSGHFITGIFGTKYILEALSMTGHAEEVFKIVNSKAYPGWGYMIDRGATYHLGDLEGERQYLFQLSPNVWYRIRVVLPLAGWYSSVD